MILLKSKTRKLAPFRIFPGKTFIAHKNGTILCATAHCFSQTRRAALGLNITMGFFVALYCTCGAKMFQYFEYGHRQMIIDGELETIRHCLERNTLAWDRVGTLCSYVLITFFIQMLVLPPAGYVPLE